MAKDGSEVFIKSWLPDPRNGSQLKATNMAAQTPGYVIRTANGSGTVVIFQQFREEGENTWEALSTTLR